MPSLTGFLFVFNMLLLCFLGPTRTWPPRSGTWGPPVLAMWNHHTTSKAGVLLQVDSASSFVCVWWCACVHMWRAHGGVWVREWVHVWSARVACLWCVWSARAEVRTSFGAQFFPILLKQGLLLFLLLCIYNRSAVVMDTRHCMPPCMCVVCMCVYVCMPVCAC